MIDADDVIRILIRVARFVGVLGIVMISETDPYIEALATFLVSFYIMRMGMSIISYSAAVCLMTYFLCVTLGLAFEQYFIFFTLCSLLLLPDADDDYQLDDRWKNAELAPDVLDPVTFLAASKSLLEPGSPLKMSVHKHSAISEGGGEESKEDPSLTEEHDDDTVSNSISTDSSSSSLTDKAGHNEQSHGHSFRASQASEVTLTSSFSSQAKTTTKTTTKSLPHAMRPPLALASKSDPHPASLREITSEAIELQEDSRGLVQISSSPKAERDRPSVDAYGSAFGDGDGDECGCGGAAAFREADIEAMEQDDEGLLEEIHQARQSNSLRLRRFANSNPSEY